MNKVKSDRIPAEAEYLTDEKVFEETAETATADSTFTRMNIFILKETHMRLKIKAAVERNSMNNIIIQALNEKLLAEK